MESEVDEDTLLEVEASGIDSLDDLTSRDLKIAVGEDVEELEEEIVEPEEEIAEEKPEEEESLLEEDELQEEDAPTIEAEPSEVPEGVEALKNLLTALSDKNVAASMKGMKISINITFGDN